MENRGVIQDLIVHKAGSDVKTGSSVEKWKKFDIKIEKKRILQCKCIERRIRELKWSRVKGLIMNLKWS